LLEDSGTGEELLEVHHAIASRGRRKGIAYSRDGLFPIKSSEQTTIGGRNSW
jgi:hypothetical protein